MKNTIIKATSIWLVYMLGQVEATFYPDALFPWPWFIACLLCIFVISLREDK